MKGARLFNMIKLIKIIGILLENLTLPAIIAYRMN